MWGEQDRRTTGDRTRDSGPGSRDKVGMDGEKHLHLLQWSKHPIRTFYAPAS
jgi:hypothetical protein